MRPTYTVRAKAWEHGYELGIEGVGVTQAADMREADAMARDFIALELDVPADSFDLAITEAAA
jgi:hypothetical protein